MSRLERKNSFLKKIAIFVVFNMVFEIVAPTVSMALTSGPSSPEFGSFEPVATNNMVDPFSGDFTYNLPVLMVPGTNGGGYPISLSYHSGTTGEQEASWVGHGWTLNPGAINRGKQGFPDDWNGEEVTNHNKAIPNITITAGAYSNLETFSISLPGSLNASISYNNYKGFGYSAGAGISFAKGFISLGFNISDGQSSFSLRVNPWQLLNKSKKESEKKREEYKETASRVAAAETEDKSKLQTKLKRLEKELKGSISAQGVYGIVSLSGDQKANRISDYTGGAFNFSVSYQAALTPLSVGPEFGFTGSVAVQANIPKTQNNAFGNYYNKNAYANDNNLMDYYTEKEHSYENNDIFLGIPHALTDQYMVSGEGIGGAFRLHNKTIGQLRPNKVNSEMVIGNLGFEFSASLNIEMGFDIGVGYHNYKQKGWDLHNGNEEYSSQNDNVFRFTNDLGGSVEFDNDQVKESAVLYKNSGVPGFKKYTPDVSGIDQQVNTNTTPGDYGIGASSYIGHNTFAQKNLTAGGIHYNSYEKNPAIEAFLDYSDANIADQIGELSVKNKSGETYNYGLPVFAREEKEISVGLTGVNPQPTVENGYIVYADGDIASDNKRNKLKIIQGQERDAAYATSYLLTSIYEPNYIDRTNNGPSEDDFGGYTKFNYKQAYGSSASDSKDDLSSGNWYQWRFPYTGMYYNRGSLSDKKDDMGAYSSGEKEMYYLEQIETKTHIAVFVTSDRMDGLSAKDNATDASMTATSKGNKKLQKLDKIELFVKDAAWEAYVSSGYNVSLKPTSIKTVNFEYDYSSVPGIPNSANGEGKLTLKRVWFDYEGIYKAQISPYEFEYNYPDYSSYPAKYTSGTDDVTAGYANFNGAPSTAENPAYHEQQLNAWGYNQTENLGKIRHDGMNPWPDQRLENGEDVEGTPGIELYDPAAWNLKMIRLPSGGEIHVQYEQDDYQYVQDKVAHVMVPLTNDSDDDNSPRYYLDTDAINVTTLAEKQALVDAIRKLYVNSGKKIFFKMLYAMTLLNINPQIEDCDVEYINGYINVEDVQLESGTNKVYIDLVTGQSDRFDLPKKVCQEYDKAYLSGKSLDQNCGIDGDLSYDENDQEGIVAQFLDILPNVPIPGVALGCASVDWENSYFRVPCINPKKGGGLRVKRLLMYTPPLHSGEEAELYGTEYIYKFRDSDGKIKSSGVASNEPTAMREENILVDNIDRLPKNEWDKLRDIITAGKEKEKFEGPIGEALYGSASVGYSQVITRNIHSGKTNNGYVINQFYTCKDFPLISDYTDLAGNTKNDYLPIPALWVNNVTNNVWAAQGYHFKVNNMHGQMKRVAMYTGDYLTAVDPTNGNLVSATEYDYFKIGDEVPVMNSLEEIVNLPLGKESEMFMESRSVKDHMHDVSAEFDAGVGIFGAIPIPMGSLFPSYTHVETELHTHVTNKITRYPAIVRSVRNYTDGIWSKSENLAFNAQTGDPVITRTYDDFNESNEADQFEIDNTDHFGWLTSYAIPAYQEYANMGQVALNEGKIYGSGPGSAGYMIDKLVDPVANTVKLNFYSAAGPMNVCDATKQLTTGDLIHIIGTSELYHISSIDGTELTVVPTYYSSASPSSATNIRFKVIRSGKTNQAATNAGTFVTYGKSIAANNTLPSITTVAIDNPAHPAYATYSQMAAVVSSLNSALGTGGTVVIPPGLIVSPSGECNTEEVTVTIASSGDGNYYISTEMTSSLQTASFWGSEVGSVRATGPNLLAVRNAATGNTVSSTIAKCGVTTPSPNYSVDRSFMLYNLASLPAGASIQNVTLRIDASGVPLSPFSIAVQKSNYGSPLDVSDYDAFTGSVLGTFTTVSGINTVSLPTSVIDPFGQVRLCLRDNVFDYVGETSPGSSTLFQFANDSPNFIDVEYYTSEICRSQIHSVDGGLFQLDPSSGALIYGILGGDCENQQFECLTFCQSIHPLKTIHKVITASAITLSDDWNYDASAYANGIANYNDFELGKRGKWRAKSNYSYKSETTGLEQRFNPFTASTSDEEFNYNSGIFDLEVFNWKYENANDPLLWLKAATILKYSPNGNALEEENILGIKSTVKYGYNEYLPYIVAANTPYESVMFESYENVYNNGLSNVLEDNLELLGGTSVSTDASHTGYSSLKFASGTTAPFFTSNEMEFTSQIQNAGLHTKVWIKNLDNDLESIKVKIKDVASPANLTGNLYKVAQTGEWTLYELNNSTWGAFNPANFTISFSIENGTPGKYFYADDIRIQPMDTEMACYVYDYKNYRLMATFDDQHFSVQYQYNAQGKLTRKLVETTKGLKTVTDGQYNSPVKNRTN